MFFLDTLFNSLLVVSSGHALYTLEPLQHPYSFMVAVFGVAHGLIGVARAVSNKPESNERYNDCGRLKLISNGIMEVIPLPLINMDLYIKSSNPGLALAHSVFFIPMAFDLIAKLNDYHDNSTETLKDLSLLGNIVSMLFLAVNENNNLYGAISALAFIARYISSLVDNYNQNLAAEAQLLGNSGIILLMTMALKTN